MQVLKHVKRRPPRDSKDTFTYIFNYFYLMGPSLKMMTENMVDTYSLGFTIYYFLQAILHKRGKPQQCFGIGVKCRNVKLQGPSEEKNQKDIY